MFVLHVAPHVAPCRHGVVRMAAAYNASASPAATLQESATASRSVVTWSRGGGQGGRGGDGAAAGGGGSGEGDGGQGGQPEQDLPDVSVASWWLPTLLRRRGLWTSPDALSRDDAGSFALGLAFCGAVGFLFGAGEPSELGVPVLPSEACQAAARASSQLPAGPRLVVTDQASVRAGARTLGEQQERQRLLVTKDRAQLAALEKVR